MTCEFLGVVEGRDVDAEWDELGSAVEDRAANRFLRPRGADAVRRVRNEVAAMGGDVFIDVGGDGMTLQAGAYDCGTEVSVATAPKAAS